MTLIGAVLAALKNAAVCKRKLTNKELYELPAISILLQSSQDDKSRSGSINKAIEGLKKREKNVFGDGSSGWYL